MNFGYYILDENGNPVLEPDVLKWAAGFEIEKRRVGLDKIGEAEISTVFLGLDHNFFGGGPPILWETMIFDDKNFDGFQRRCSGNKEQAEAMHQEVVEMVEAFYGKIKNDKES